MIFRDDRSDFCLKNVNNLWSIAFDAKFVGPAGNVYELMATISVNKSSC